MMQEQKPIFSIQKQGHRVQELLSRRLLASIVLALGSTLVLVLLELGSLFVFNKFHTFTFPFSFLVGLLLLLLEFALIFVGAFLMVKPLAIIVYLQTIHRAQEYYNQSYVSLTSITNTRKTAASHQEQTVSTVPIQDEQVSILNLIEQQDFHQLIVGMPGAGKTMAMHIYQYQASKKFLSLLSAPGKIPIYIPMKKYSLFLKRQKLPLPEFVQEDEFHTQLLKYMEQGDLQDIRYLRNYIGQLFRQGRLLLLCDGLDEVANDYLVPVGVELGRMMRDTRNRFVITCREIDYRQQPDLVQLVEEGQAAHAVIHPLQPDQIAEVVEGYIEKQDKQWRHTAGQIMSVIERSRLRYHCTNPLMLFTLMGIIDKVGVERGKQTDTRSLLLHEYVKQALNSGRKQAKWSQRAPAEQEVISYLSEIAYAAHWTNTIHAVQLPVASQAPGGSRNAQNRSVESADKLRAWLDADPVRTALLTDDEHKSISYSDAPELLQLALDAELIDIGSDDVLSFRHELIAEYFVAEYLSTRKSISTSTMREELLQHVEHWSEPVALWAGLLDEPLELAESFEDSDLDRSTFMLEKLALSLICVGVLWKPPQADIQRVFMLPQSIEEALSIAVREKDTREALARIFTLCAEEGGQEIYRSLLSIIMVEGADEFVTLLDQNIVPDLLFTQLQDAIDNAGYESQVKRIARVLGRFGGVVGDRAAQLSLPAPERSARLRAAVINMLGGTNHASAVQPLIARLRDTEAFIVERTVNALIRLGPALSLTQVLQEIENRMSEPSGKRIHQAALLILERFMSEQDRQRRLSSSHYQSTIERVVSVLTSNYQDEPEIQRQAREIVVRQGQRLGEASAQDASDTRWTALMDVLLSYLSSQDDVTILNVTQALQEIGAPVVPRLLELLHNPADDVRVHTIEILNVVRDSRALPALLPLLTDKSHAVQQRVARALYVYAPESIPGLINGVLHDPSDAVADRAAQILVDIGQDVVKLVIEALPVIVPGRTRFLVQILEIIHDPGSIAVLVSLLNKAPQLEPLLVISIIRALGQFSDKQVVAPLLEVLATTNPQFYEEAVTALSQLGDVALEGLIVALDVDHDSTIVQRVRRAILGMSPFPGELLMRALEQSTESQVDQILTIFRMQGREGAAVLARYLLHPDEWLRHAIQQTLESMPGPVVVPGLLAVLPQPTLREIASTFLLKYPDAAVAPLVGVLGEQERGAIAAALLPQFGLGILTPLIAGLDDPRSMAHESARRALVDLVHQKQEQGEERHVLQEIVRLFGDPLPPRAREALMSILTNEFARISLPVLLEGLEDVHLIESVAEALTRLVDKPALQERVLSSLVEALGIEDRRSGSEIALVRIGAPAVARVGELITNSDPAVARAAMHILSEIGVPALAFIWTAYSDRNNPARRKAARAIFRRMPPEVIKDELVSLLISKNRDDMSMAVALLLERIDDETQMDFQDQVMVPELLDYIETHNVQETNLRIIALLLLLGEQAITDHLIQALDDNPQHREQLTSMLLLLGPKTHALLLEVLADPNTNSGLRNDIAGVLSMLKAPDALTDHVYKLSEYGLSQKSAGALFSEQLALALRALGGLLVSGQWHPRKLMELRDARDSNDPGYELFNILLGWRYTPEIEKLQRDMDVQSDMFKKELLALTMKVTEEQQRISNLETDLEKARQEHGVRNDELQKTSHERDAMRINLEKVTNEKNKQQVTLEETTRRYNALLAQYQGLQKQLQGISQGQDQRQSQGLNQGPRQINKPQNPVR